MHHSIVPSFLQFLSPLPIVSDAPRGPQKSSMRVSTFIKLPGGELQRAVSLLDGDFYAQLGERLPASNFGKYTFQIPRAHYESDRCRPRVLFGN